MKKAIVSLVGLLCLVSLAAAAADFWEKKKFNQWNENEVRKLLSDSPWAEEKTFSEIYASDINRPSRDPQTGAGGVPLSSPGSVGGGPTGREDESAQRDIQANPRTSYTGVLMSALPVRQARVRWAQLREGYDNLPAEKKAEFDKQAEQYLSARYDEVVILSVTYSSNLLSDTRDLNQYWGQQTLDRLHTTTYLIGTDGRRVPLKEYGKPEGKSQTFQLVFPRQLDGVPVLTAKDKRLQFEFIHPDIRNQGEKRVLLEFRPNKMLVDGQLEF